MLGNPLPPVENRHPEAYAITPARYAKGKYTVRVLDSRDGYKGHAGSAADDVKARWVNRSHGYCMSAAQVRRFQDAYEAKMKSRSVAPE